MGFKEFRMVPRTARERLARFPIELLLSEALSYGEKLVCVQLRMLEELPRISRAFALWPSARACSRDAARDAVDVVAVPSLADQPQGQGHAQ